MTHDLFDYAEAACLAIAKRSDLIPKVAIVLGSGLANLADAITDPTIIPHTAIPPFPLATVEGHAGNVILGHLEGVPVVALQGRFHSYEGHDFDAVTFPIRVFKLLGANTLILTAATGGINTSFRPGDLMLLTDHLNLIGANPLRGRNDIRFGPRFPDMTEVYDLRLRTIAEQVATDLGHTLKQGVYAALSGPSYETPAEIRMLRTLGADVVGMSTVPEAIVARHQGMNVLAFALVTNVAAGVLGTPITHEEVLEAGREAGPRMGSIIAGVVGAIGATTPNAH